MSKRILSITVITLMLIQPAAWAGLSSKSARYVGGTWTNLPDGTEGRLDLSDTKEAFFYSEKNRLLRIPYKQITSLEYGQKAGRRVGATIGWGVTTMGVAALPMLLSKKRKHYFTVGWTDEEGQNHGVVLELGKNITRSTLTVFETRSGKQIDYESEDARKHIGN